MCYFEGMTRPFATGVRQVTQWLALIWWVAVILALVWFEVNDPLTWPHVSRFAAIAVGVIGGLLITRRHWWLALVPLSGFVIGGWLLSTQFSNTQGYGGGDWSVAAIVVVSGIFNGLIATLILLNTALARGPLRMVVHWPANRRPGASTAG